jgi:hypothetical protein
MRDFRSNFKTTCAPTGFHRSETLSFVDNLNYSVYKTRRCWADYVSNRHPAPYDEFIHDDDFRRASELSVGEFAAGRAVNSLC